MSPLYWKYIAGTKSKWNKSEIDKFYNIYKSSVTRSKFGSAVVGEKRQRDGTIPAARGPPGIPNPASETEYEESEDEQILETPNLVHGVPDHWVFDNVQTGMMPDNQFIYYAPDRTLGERSAPSPWGRFCIVRLGVFGKRPKWTFFYINTETGERLLSLKEVFKHPSVAGPFYGGFDAPTQRVRKGASISKKRRLIDAKNREIREDKERKLQERRRDKWSSFIDELPQLPAL